MQQWVQQGIISPNPGNPIFHNKPLQLLIDGGPISAQWSHQCRVFLWCAWWVWPKPGSAPAAGLLHCCRREGKNIREERVHDIISPGLLRSSPTEGWERWPTFPSELPSPVSSPPGSLEHKVTEHRIIDTNSMDTMKHNMDIIYSNNTPKVL